VAVLEVIAEPADAPNPRKRRGSQSSVTGAGSVSRIVSCCLALVAISFHAQLVDVSRKDWGWLIAWSVDEDLARERYLVLQRKDEFTEQDTSFGWDNVYIECCGQGWFWYGHIVSFELLPERVRVQMDAEAAKDMRDDGHIEVTFELSAERFAELQRALSEVFDGYSYYKETAV